MSQHSGPHFTTAPSDQRCEVLVKGIPSYHWEWQRVDHRCPRTSNQGRDGKQVCAIHGRAKKVQYIAEPT